MRYLFKRFFNITFNSFGRTLGRVICYLFIAYIVMFLFNGCAKAQTYTATDVPLSDSYYNYFSGIVNGLPASYNYKAFTYDCGSSGYYSRSCYYLSYGENYENYVRFVRNDNDSSYILQKGVDNSFNVNGNLVYSNLEGFSDLNDERRYNNVQIASLFALCSIFLFTGISGIFKR